MARPIRQLPLVQNWDCHMCGTCCTDYVVPVSDEERQRISKQGWQELPEYKDVPLFKRYSPWWKFWRKKYRLNQGEGNRCIFLNDKGLCRIHEKFGVEAKPFPCRLYPYILVPFGDHLRVSVRFACPSAASNKGRPLTEQTDDLKRMAAEFETWGDRPRQEAVSATVDNEKARLSRPPRLQGWQQIPWKDLNTFLEAFISILQEKNDPFPRRMLRCLTLLRTCQQARFDKLSGARLREFLNLIVPTTWAEVPRDLSKMEPPGWIGRLLFRSTLALYLRKDSGVRIGVAKRGRIALLGAIFRMVRGKGQLPELQKGLPLQDFMEFEQPAGTLPQVAEAVLERYYQIKIASLQFCGPAFYGVPVWEGFAALALTLPAILWLARGYRDLGQPAAIERAITIIDENYGYSPLLGQSRQRMATRVLLSRRELDRLIAWYSR
jgi:lysine-N-methylase